MMDCCISPCPPSTGGDPVPMWWKTGAEAMCWWCNSIGQVNALVRQKGKSVTQSKNAITTVREPVGTSEPFHGSSTSPLQRLCRWGSETNHCVSEFGHAVDDGGRAVEHHGTENGYEKGKLVGYMSALQFNVVSGGKGAYPDKPQHFVTAARLQSRRVGTLQILLLLLGDGVLASDLE